MDEAVRALVQLVDPRLIERGLVKQRVQLRGHVTHAVEHSTLERYATVA
jgi:hypothetical protein